MRPKACIYPCSACCKIVKWNESAMYLLHNPKAFLRNYVFLFLCEECFVDSIFQSFSFYDNMFNNGLINADFDIPDHFDVEQFIPVNQDNHQNNKKYYYIDDNLKALITQDDEYLSKQTWKYEDDWKIGHRFSSYEHAFYFFISNYEPELEFIPILLKTIAKNNDLPICFNNKFIDHIIHKSQLNDNDKLYFKELKKNNLRICCMNIANILPEELCEYSLEF